MAVQLKGLLGKTPRPIIVNGKVICVGRSPVLASVHSFKEIYEVSGSNKELGEETGNLFIMQALRQFQTKYGEILQGTGYSSEEVQGRVDSFTGAIVVNSSAFQLLYEEEHHSANAQHTAKVRQLLRDFMAEYIADYYDTYIYFLNRRVAAQHMPSIVKAHFTHGLFQPLIVGTSEIKSPFLFDENIWLYDAFHSAEEHLERKEDNARKLNLSCIAMCDIASAMNTNIVRELDRREFMLMMCLCALSQLDQKASQELANKYGSVLQKIMGEKSRVELFSAMMKYATTARTSLKVV